MTQPSAVERAGCLNCGAELHGPFWSACGQRVIPPYPSVRDMAGDAWHELSGYDGRFASTFGMLLRHPGRLTREVLEGRRARYISPVRLYLVASVAYFLVAATAPNLQMPRASMPTEQGTMQIDLFNPQGANAMTPEQRAQALEQLERAPVWARAVMRPVIIDPAGFRNRLMIVLPRVFFVLVPVFAGIVALFERRRRFLQHLVFALHLHATVFIALAVARITHFSGFPIVAVAFGVATFIFIGAYGLMAFRTVYRDPWKWLLPKLAGIAFLYAIAGALAMTAVVTWTALTS